VDQTSPRRPAVALNDTEYVGMRNFERAYDRLPLGLRRERPDASELRRRPGNDQRGRRVLPASRSHGGRRRRTSKPSSSARPKPMTGLSMSSSATPPWRRLHPYNLLPKHNESKRRLAPPFMRDRHHGRLSGLRAARQTCREAKRSQQNRERTSANTRRRAHTHADLGRGSPAYHWP
jgi:hypothetical protein